MTDSIEFYDWTRISSALTASLTSVEQAEFDAWVQRSPERKALLKKVSIIVDPANAIPFFEDAQELEGESRKLLARVHNESNYHAGSLLRIERSFNSRHKYLRRSLRYSVAAIVATVLVVAGVMRFGSSVHKHADITIQGEYKMYSTRAGQRASIDLADGSRVYLSVGSTLEIPRDFGVTNRTVRLIGHAVFNVQQQAETPFIVNALGTQSTVLGTAFSVRAYTPDVRVTVKSGRVSVDACGARFGQEENNASSCPRGQRSVVVSANEAALVSARGRVNARRNIDLETDFAFVSGRLMLQGASLGEMIDDLNRWYDVDIRLNDSSLAKQVLGGWLAVGSIEELEQYLAGILPVRVERVERVLTLYPISPSKLEVR